MGEEVQTWVEGCGCFGGERDRRAHVLWAALQPKAVHCCCCYYYQELKKLVEEDWVASSRRERNEMKCNSTFLQYPWAKKINVTSFYDFGRKSLFVRRAEQQLNLEQSTRYGAMVEWRVAWSTVRILLRLARSTKCFIVFQSLFLHLLALV